MNPSSIYVHINFNPYSALSLPLLGIFLNNYFLWCRQEVDEHSFPAPNGQYPQLLLQGMLLLINAELQAAQVAIISFSKSVYQNTRSHLGLFQFVLGSIWHP